MRLALLVLLLLRVFVLPPVAVIVVVLLLLMTPAKLHSWLFVTTPTTSLLDQGSKSSLEFHPALSQYIFHRLRKIGFVVNQENEK